eukprot:CAMPEP_0176499668 /NCGR_PEP_ID=MMETSP0200_2-20121128/13062_1 /TAXON_ID=947934 /ORGANISM="Chaetoceros sp., Strain GSL56" /LENGTH=331 /DNA_ID=CAMNT_0017898127 /DNA_START=73 /DNA_END=1068 /DNA_ORIENTATION=-
MSSSKTTTAFTTSSTAASGSSIGSDITTNKANKRRKPCPSEAEFNSKLKDQSSLRYISSKVCKIVESKGTTTYNEVANELVIEALKLFDGEHFPEKKKKDHEKNIRRRVYDALNVLLATDIMSKTKERDNREKTIHWKGYRSCIGSSSTSSPPSASCSELVNLEREKQVMLAEIEKKKRCLQELLVQNVCFQNLENRNKRMKLYEKSKEEDRIPLPFIVVNAAENAVIQCEMNQDQTDVMFDFDVPFEINDDNEILKKLGMSQASYQDLETLLPRDIFNYCNQHQLLDVVLARSNTSYPMMSDLSHSSSMYCQGYQQQQQQQQQQQYHHRS